MLRPHVFLAILLSFLMVFASACGPTPTSETGAGGAPSPKPTTVAEVPSEATNTSEAPPEAANTSVALPEGTATTETLPEATAGPEKDWEDFDPANFDRSAEIDSSWLPYKPGMQWVYKGITIEEGETIPHRLVTTVTDLTKVIGGVRTVVVWDQDFADDELVEAELAFFAQDKDGNVWHMGEYPEEYEDGKFVDAPAWIHGFEDARAGISMMANPQPGTPSYSQGWGPAVDWTDRGRVAKVVQWACVPVDCYEDVVVIEEGSRSEPNAFQLKYYAPGVGNVRVGWKGDDPTKETLDLVKFVQLSPEALADVRAEALALEKHAYEVNPDVYGQTPPAEALTGSAALPGATAGLEKDWEDFDAANFDRSAEIDNPWLPMKPGTRFVYEGTSVEDDGTSVPHRVEMTITDLIKVIGGVRSVVSWDLDYSNDELVEAELAFYAQDKEGNVWRMGEYPEEYEGGKFVEAPTWIHGLEDARAGIAMKADPQPGAPSYSQGWGPAVDYTDRAQVADVGQQTCVPVDCYEDVLVTEEFNQEEPGAFQLKYYARGVGNVQVGWRGDDPTQERLELVKFVQLSPKALAKARAGALALEKHAYKVSKEVYGQTPPAERLPAP